MVQGNQPRNFSFVPFVLGILMVMSATCSSVAAQPQNDNTPQTSTPQAQTGHSDPGPDQPPPPAAKPAPAPPPKPQTPPPEKKDAKSDDEEELKIRISVVAAETGKPVGNASVYIRFPEGRTFFTHKDKEAEMNFKTNQDGSVKVPGVPRGKILIQIVAPGWHTYGKWYDIEKDDEQIDIKLDKPPRWY